MLRGEIRMVDLEPARGNEANKTRPAVIVSNDRSNQIVTRLNRGVITVVPVTTNLSSIHPFQILLTASATGLKHDSKAQAEQVRAVTFERMGRVVGRMTLADMDQLDEALRLHLQL